MTFLQRMKKDKKFRFRVILIAILVLMAVGQVPGEKKEALVSQDICDQANTKGCEAEFGNQGTAGCLERNIDGSLDAQAGQDCVSLLCNVGRKIDTQGGERVDSYACFSLVPNGLRAKLPDDCVQDKTLINAESDYPYLCTAFPPGVEPSTRTCNAAMEGIADIVQSFLPDLGCTSAFYIAVFGGAMIILMTFAAL